VRALLYGAGATLLILDLVFLIQGLISFQYIPLLPVGAGVLTTTGLLLIVYSESKTYTKDRIEHHRLARVAHQLESPLVSLRADIEQLLLHSHQLPSELRLTLKHMETRSVTLLENIRDVFLYLESHEGSLAHDVRIYDLCVLLHEVIETHKKYAAAKNVELMYAQKCDKAPVRLDRRLFMIALSHLLENGITYTMTPGLVNVALAADKQSVRLVIQDRGIGLPQQERHDIWEPFQRGHGAEQYDNEGIGLGLTLSRIIIEEFGGKLTVTPRTDSMGLTAEIELPLAKK